MGESFTPANYFDNNNVTFAFDLTTKGTAVEPRDAASWDDATWILTSSFIIFTMQSGECSQVSRVR